MRWTKEEQLVFHKALSIAWAAYDKELSAETSGAMGRMLADKGYTLKECLSAIHRVAGKVKRAPTLPDIMGGLEGDPANRGRLAWLEVLEALDRVGTYNSIRFRDPIINATLHKLVGTWANMRNHDDGKGLVWHGRDFERLYNEIAAKGKVTDPGHLPGQLEIDNNRVGFDDHVPTPIEYGSSCPIRQLKITSPKQVKPTPKMAELVEDTSSTHDPSYLGQKGGKIES